METDKEKLYMNFAEKAEMQKFLKKEEELSNGISFSQVYEVGGIVVARQILISLFIFDLNSKDQVLKNRDTFNKYEIYFPKVGSDDWHNYILKLILSSDHNISLTILDLHSFSNQDLKEELQYILQIRPLFDDHFNGLCREFKRYLRLKDIVQCGKLYLNDKNPYLHEKFREKIEETYLNYHKYLYPTPELDIFSCLYQDEKDPLFKHFDIIDFPNLSSLKIKVTKHILIVAQSGGGKSLLMQTLAAKHLINGDKVIYISLEMPLPQILNNIVSIIYQHDNTIVPYTKEEAEVLTKDFKERYSENLKLILGLDFSFENIAYYYKSKEFQDYPIIIIDYLQRLPSKDLNLAYLQEKENLQKINNLTIKYNKVTYNGSQIKKEAKKELYNKTKGQGDVAGSAEAVYSPDIILGLYKDNLDPNLIRGDLIKLRYSVGSIQNESDFKFAMKRKGILLTEYDPTLLMKHDEARELEKIDADAKEKKEKKNNKQRNLI